MTSAPAAPASLRPLTVAGPPKAAAPSLNWTVPVADAGVIRAVNVTACPTVDGFAEELTATVAITLSTTCEMVVAVLGASFVSPE